MPSDEVDHGEVTAEQNPPDDLLLTMMIGSISELLPGEVTTRSINSCLAPVGGLDGAAVTTVEGIGCSAVGLHPIQGGKIS